MHGIVQQYAPPPMSRGLLCHCLSSPLLLLQCLSSCQRVAGCSCQSLAGCILPAAGRPPPLPPLHPPARPPPTHYSPPDCRRAWDCENSFSWSAWSSSGVMPFVLGWLRWRSFWLCLNSPWDSSTSEMKDSKPSCWGQQSRRGAERRGGVPSKDGTKMETRGWKGGKGGGRAGEGKGAREKKKSWQGHSVDGEGEVQHDVGMRRWGQNRAVEPQIAA